MTKYLLWFAIGPDANDVALYFINNRLQVHLLGFGFSEAAD